MSLDFVSDALAGTGLVVRGGFHPDPDDGVPPMGSGRAAGTLVIVGNVGSDMWPAFRAAPEHGFGPDPLNRWTKRVLDGVCGRLGAEALYPFGGPPHLPFQRWAQRAEPVFASPLGLLIHPDFGLWHAYRGALAFEPTLDLPPPDSRPSPCETCAERPCLDACPVAAFGPGGYDVAACVDHIAGPAGRDCMELACRARRACPVGRAYRYAPEHAVFHMEAFLSAYRSED